jgi:hypothetical protein
VTPIDTIVPFWIVVEPTSVLGKGQVVNAGRLLMMLVVDQAVVVLRGQHWLKALGTSGVGVEIWVLLVQVRVAVGAAAVMVQLGEELGSAPVDRSDCS